MLSPTAPPVHSRQFVLNPIVFSLSLQEKRKKENRLVNRLGITKVVDDLKELFSTMTGFRQSVNPAANTQTELLLKMCKTLETLPDRMQGKSVPAASAPISVPDAV